MKVKYMNYKRLYGTVICIMMCGLLIIAGCMIYSANPVLSAHKLCTVFAETLEEASLSAFLKNKPVVLLDPGHGGIDGGAESADGECEKNINLKICFKIRDILDKNGVKTVMTRESDHGLYSDDRGSIRSKKTEDLHARLDMSYRLKPDAFVSIHLNSYREDRRVFGAQTFYTTASDAVVSEMSRILAERIQSLLTSYIENGNKRTAMGKNDVLIMKEAVYPTVIVECGFLSNAEEAAALQTDEYQSKAAKAIADGILSYFGIEKNPNNSEKIKVITS